ncbi:hypothetical protein ACTPOK_02075 [Streptomyces inhibens]|uniref:hypothetical protein n=1 Tax=Streptomyces inhibens TaxID=2293571 RepID=UPI00402AEEAE
MLTFALALKDMGVPVPEIAKKLTVKTGKRAAQIADQDSVRPRQLVRRVRVLDPRDLVRGVCDAQPASGAS